MILERGYLRQTFRMVCFVHFVFSLCVFLMCFVCVHYFLLRFLLQQTTFDVIYIYIAAIAPLKYFCHVYV